MPHSSIIHIYKLGALSLVDRCVQTRVCKHSCDVLASHLFYKCDRALFWYLQNLILTLGGLVEFSKVISKPSTMSRVCITVSNSPNCNPPCVQMRLCKHGKSAPLLILEVYCIHIDKMFNTDLIILMAFVVGRRRRSTSGVQSSWLCLLI